MSPNPQETADLVTFTEEILNGKLHFLCSEVNEIISNVFSRRKISLNKNKTFFQSQKFGSVEYDSLSLTERSFLRALCFGEYIILHLFSYLLLSTNQFRSIFSFPSNIPQLSQSIWLMRRMLRMRMLRMRTVYYLPVRIYRPVHVWNMTPVPKFCYFFSNQVFSNQRIQVMWIYTCFVLPR